MSLPTHVAIRCSALLVAVACVAANAIAAGPAPCSPPAATIASVQGAVDVRRAGRGDWLPAAYRDELCTGDVVRVGDRGRAAIVLRNEIELRLDEKTSLTLAKVDAAEGSLLEMCAGKLHFISRARKSLRVVTPFVNATVEGTEVAIGHAATEDRIDVFEGHVLASSEAARTMPQTCGDARMPTDTGGRLLLASRESALVPAGGAPAKRIAIAQPADAVQWALYYPPLVEPGPDAAAAGTAIEARALRSAAQYRQGRLDDALAAIAPSGDDASVRDARFFSYRASLLLWVGRVDEARRDIDRALALDARNADALALQSVVAVVQNRKDAALDLARRAVEFDERSVAARLALSYALQAHLRIEDALAAAMEATRLQPADALAWARVAELEMSAGRHRLAVAAAERAQSTNANAGRAHTVLGFARLARLETVAAKEAFERAIAADPADPMPRLGLGLAKIRQNALAEGRADLELAVSLDPASSILRSYVGKAYFEEGRNALAASQFELAKERDPVDPTPWFYASILAQTENRPIDALGELEQSIERNDRRAPYRSTLLLDEDRAARAVSLAWIFDELGLDQLALTEAASAQAADPASSAGHQFLADAFGRQRRQEITRVSELLQAQLLQPAILAPLQPETTFRSLTFLAGDSPLRASYGEYSALFDRERPNARVALAGGNLDTRSDVVAVSSRSGPWSFGAGQFYYHTDGYRPNNDITHRVYNAMAQLTATPGVDVQVEFRHRRSDNGDLGSYGAPDIFDPGFRQQVTHDIARFGVHASASPDSHWLFSYLHGKRSEEVLTPGFDIGDLTSKGTDDGDQAELMYIHRSGALSLVTGAGWYGFDEQRSDTFGEGRARSTAASPTRGRAAAMPTCTATFGLPYRTRMLVGVSYDRQRMANLEINKVNPKFGVMSEPIDGLTLRAAAFRSVKPALIANQTLEPTQVFGFSQYADDANGTISERYAIGADARHASSVYAGAEASWRRLRYPLNAVDVPFFLEPRERMANAYVAWLPASWVALSARAEHEQWRLDSEVGATLGLPSRITTTDVPLEARLFRAGWSLRATTHLVDQRVETRGKRRHATASAAALPSPTSRSRIVCRSGWASYRVEVRNLFDRSFRLARNQFPIRRAADARFVPTRTMTARVSLYF